MADALQARLEHALALLGRPRADEREAGATELVELAHDPGLAEQVRPHLFSLLRDAHPPLRAAACAGLLAASTPEQALSAVEPALADADARVRREAAHTLAVLEDPRAKEALHRALADTDAQVNFEAAAGLAALGDRGGVEVLLQNVDDRFRRFAALGALAQLGEARAREPAERLLTKFFVSDFERTQAAGLLAKLGVEAGRAHLLARVQKRRADDRGLAMELCGEHRILAAIPALREALGDTGDVFRGTAARSLGMLGEDPSGGALARLARDAHEDLGVRCDAMEGLMFLGTAGALAELESLHQSGESAEVREAAGDALAWLAARKAPKPEQGGT